MAQQIETMRDRSHHWRRILLALRDGDNLRVRDLMVDVLDHVNHLEARIEVLEKQTGRRDE